MAKNKEEMLKEMYQHFNNRDAESVLNTMTEDVDWPNGWEGERVNGKDAVREYWLQQWEAVDPQVEPKEFLDLEDGRVQVTVHQTVRNKDGELVDDRTVVHCYRFEDERVSGMDIHWS